MQNSMRLAFSYPAENATPINENMNNQQVTSARKSQLPSTEIGMLGESTRGASRLGTSPPMAARIRSRWVIIMRPRSGRNAHSEFNSVSASVAA